MSTVMHPVGPQPSGVYWVRRALVVLIAVVVVVLVTTLLEAVVGSRSAATTTDSSAVGTGGDGDGSAALAGGPGDDADQDAQGDAATGSEDGDDADGGDVAAVPSGSEDDAAATEEGAGEDGTGAGSDDATDGTADDAAAADDADGSTLAVTTEETEEEAPRRSPVTCAAADLALTVTTDARSYAPGVAPELTVAITNTGDVPCTIDAADGHRDLVVTSGSDRVWSTADCAGEGAERLLLLEPGARDETTSTWHRIRSAEGCPDELPEPGPGTYAAEVSLAGAESATAVFELD